MNVELVREVLSDESFRNRLLESTEEEFQAALKEKGLEFSNNDIAGMYQLIKAPKNEDGSLTTGELEGVAGGLALTTAACIAVAFFVGGTIVGMR